MTTRSRERENQGFRCKMRHWLVLSDYTSVIEGSTAQIGNISPFHETKFEEISNLGEKEQ